MKTALQKTLEAARDACTREAMQDKTTGLERNHYLGLAAVLRAQVNVEHSKRLKGLGL